MKKQMKYKEKTKSVLSDYRELVSSLKRNPVELSALKFCLYNELPEMLMYFVSSVSLRKMDKKTYNHYKKMIAAVDNNLWEYLSLKIDEKEFIEKFIARQTVPIKRSGVLKMLLSKARGVHLEYIIN